MEEAKKEKEDRRDSEAGSDKKEKKSDELLLEARKFFESYKKEIGKSIREGRNVINIDFNSIVSFSHEIAELLLVNPDNILQILEIALEETGLIKNPKIRLLGLPEEYSEKIRNLRAKHLHKMVQIEGIVRQASEVRPQVISAKFECPSCGTIMSILQIEARFREPSRCSCGRKGGFKLISKDMVDAQRIVIEESPESLIGGEQPKRISVFLKEDLVDPKMEERTTPGSRVRVIGILKEIPKLTQTGGLLTKYDIAIESNNVIPLEESFEELDISEEDERQIKELAADERIFDKFTESIAPSVYGHDEIKKALVLQLFGGIKKVKGDGTKTRGDMHVLLVGDPGVAKSVNKDAKILYFSKNLFGYERIEDLHKKFEKNPEKIKVLTIDMKSHSLNWCKIRSIIKHAPEKELIKITTEHGKEVIATKDHSFISLNANGEIVAIKGEEVDEKTYLPLPIDFHKQRLKFLDARKFNSHKTNSKQLPDKIELCEDFGFFTGIFLSEGYIMKSKKSKSIIISNKNKKIKQRVRKFIKKTGLSFSERRNEIWISSVSLSNLIGYYCYLNQEIKSKVKGNYTKLKKIPDFAYFSPREFIKGLISGIFSGDGRFINDKKRLKGIELTTISKELAEGTSELLFGVGVINKIIKREYEYKNEKRHLYIVSIPFYEVAKFLSAFKFYGRKLLSCPKAVYSYGNMIPCGAILYELTKKLGYNKRIGGDRTFAAEMRTVRKRNEIGRIRLRKILSMFSKRMKKREKEFLILEKIANSPIVWSKVKKIENYKKEKEVYDLCVPETNTFSANGICVHNSQMLKFISTIAPKGRYVAGRGTSGAGLTATVVRDEFLRGWSLEAGAMVLANKGLICVDEIEKMDPQDRSAMHESMEQQTVTISKANVQASLRSETSVLAAANPKFGRFDLYETVAKQIDLPPTLINRFDVIFILKDIPDRAKDEAIATHVLLEHQDAKAKAPIEKALFKKYVAYSKQKISPKLTNEAVDEIKKFYIDLRNAPTSIDQPTRPLPISARQLEALIRLSEACARLRLSKKVTKQDSKVAIDLMKYYLMQVGYDYKTKTFDIDRIATGVSTSQRSKIMLVKETLARLESRLGKLIPIEEIRKELENKVEDKDIDEALEKLTTSGDIFHPRKGFVQRM